ncbi:MAG: hypothetical protein QGH11_00165, partial [Pirellulaceae bacterium]|nr:hypothetical protein [Pirellulaceae bacterium]
MFGRLVQILFLGAILVPTTGWPGLAGQEKEPQQGSSRAESFVGLKIDANSVPEPKKVPSRETVLPLELSEGEHVMLIGNTLLDYAQFEGFFETLLQQRCAGKKLVVRTLAWSA